MPVSPYFGVDTWLESAPEVAEFVDRCFGDAAKCVSWLDLAGFSMLGGAKESCIIILLTEETFQSRPLQNQISQ